VLFIQNNKIQEQGPYKELVAAGNDFAALMDKMAIALRAEEEARTRAASVGSDSGHDDAKLAEPVGPTPVAERVDIREKEASDGVKAATLDAGKDGELHDKEERKYGYVGKDVYAYYCKQAHVAVMVFAILFVSLQVYIPTAATFVLGAWTDAVRHPL